MNSLKVLMYSFKGGAGRTVSTANIAFVLARELRKRVLVIDLDVESAGSSVLFEVDDAVERGESWSIQDVLRGYHVDNNRPAEPMLRTADNSAVDTEGRRTTINLNVREFEARVWPKLHFHIWPEPGSAQDAGGAYLKFVPARRMLYSPDEVSGGTNASNSFQFLLKRIDALAAAPDIILLDSASGLQNTAMMGFGSANVLAIFARWSRQFVNGTMQFIDDYVLSSVGRRLETVLLVPTAVPRVLPVGNQAAELDKRREKLKGNLWRANRDAIRLFGKADEWIAMAGPIREADALKWDDRILLREGAEYISESRLDDVLADYRSVAAKLADIAVTRKATLQTRTSPGQRVRA